MLVRSILFLTAFCGGLFGQTLTQGFQFPATVKPGDTVTVTGTDLASITAVTLKASGKPDLAATSIQTTPTSVTFTIPPNAAGSYTVALSPGSITPIPLTVTSPQQGTAPSAGGGVGSSPAVTTNTSRTPWTLYMPDGQLQSHLISIFVTPDIPANESPRLRLFRSHALTEKNPSEDLSIEPEFTASNQNWTESVNGQQVPRSGTLLLFDLRGIDFGFKPVLRVLPVVSWSQGGTAAGSREVNIGSIVAVVSWTLLVVCIALLIIIVLSLLGGGSPLLLLTGVDGHLSLAQTQVACWTVAVGGVVLGYGIIRLEIPDIPASLLVLMGASLATGGIGFFQDAQKQQAAARAGVALSRRDLALGDLLRVFPPGGAPELSLAKAQMLFWTILLLVLFVSKSTLEGAIWDVPWPLVALMGFSQAGYLAPKLTSQPPTLQQPAPQNPI
jgi:IPT/TIG domain